LQAMSLRRRVERNTGLSRPTLAAHVGHPITRSPDVRRGAGCRLETS
jgi:hypothetical protein